MQITLGFIVVFFLIILPGVIFRRLYFFGEFSKQFSTNYSLVKLLGLCSLPGLINLAIIFFIYDYFIVEIDLGFVVDKLKDISNPNFRFENSDDIPLRELLKNETFPFIGFLYSTSCIFGLLSGRFIRLTKLDTKFKNLRFKNYWFYLFNGEHIHFKKMQFLKEEKRKHVFTSADVLVDTEIGPCLYSGIIVDYELNVDDSTTLSKIMLRSTKRYPEKGGKRKAVEIPGSIFILDCDKIKNLNLTYVYQESKTFLESRIPHITNNIFGLIYIILFIFTCYKVKIVNHAFYETYFNFWWLQKIIGYLCLVQAVGIINPFVETDNEYKWVDSKYIATKVIWAFIFGLITFLLN